MSNHSWARIVILPNRCNSTFPCAYTPRVYSLEYSTPSRTFSDPCDMRSLVLYIVATKPHIPSLRERIYVTPVNNPVDSLSLNPYSAVIGFPYWTLSLVLFSRLLVGRRLRRTFQLTQPTMLLIPRYYHLFYYLIYTTVVRYL